MIYKSGGWKQSKQRISLSRQANAAPYRRYSQVQRSHSTKPRRGTDLTVGRTPDETPTPPAIADWAPLRRRGAPPRPAPHTGRAAARSRSGPRLRSAGEKRKKLKKKKIFKNKINKSASGAEAQGGSPHCTG